MTVVISFNSFPKTFHQRIMYIWSAIYQSALLQGSYCHFNLIAGLYSYMFIAFIRSKRHLLVIFFTRMKQWWLINKKNCQSTAYGYNISTVPWSMALVCTKSIDFNKNPYFEVCTHNSYVFGVVFILICLSYKAL